MGADRPIVVALTGQFGAGCTTVADFLREEEKFKAYRFSEVVEGAARERVGQEKYDQLEAVDKRTVLQDQGNILRQANATAIAGVIIARIQGECDETQNVVVETTRNPAEVEAFREAFGSSCFVVALDAPLRERFERKHRDYGDDLEQFKRDDARDKGEHEPQWGQRTEECVYLADISINNHEHLVSRRDWDRFFTKIREYLNLMRQPAFRPPTYEELYMRQAYAISLKSSCTKRQVGAVLVSEIDLEPSERGATVDPQRGKRASDKRESYVVATGFNDVPIGDLICREQGPRDNPRFCPKDDEEEQKLRQMAYCPSCGAKLTIPEGRVRAFPCPGCGARLPRDFVPGRMLDTCRAVHAEEGAILQAAKLGSTALRGATLYSTTFPCLLCAKSIINAGIERVVYNEPYPMDDVVEMLQRCGAELDRYEGVNARSFDRLFKATLD